MTREDKLYIESYIKKIVSLTVEIGYSIDKFGNIVYKNKENTIDKLNQLIENESKKIGVSQEEIRRYLIKYYNEISMNPEVAKESKEIIGLLNNKTIADTPERKSKNIDKAR